MAESAGPGDAFAIGDDAQYRPVRTVGAQRVAVAAPLLEVSPAAMAQGANRLDRGLRYDQHVRGLARAAGLPFRHRLVRLAGVGHAAADVLADRRTREIVFAGSRGQPRA